MYEGEEKKNPRTKKSQNRYAGSRKVDSSKLAPKRVDENVEPSN